MTEPIKIIDVRPKIPEALQAIQGLSQNLWFIWHHDVQDLFRRMNPDLWDETGKNPVALLCRLKQEEMKSLSSDEGFLANLERVRQEFERYMSRKLDPEVFGGRKRPFDVAYFTAECGVADCLPVYSGGLGILSGDHLKSASDLNLPITGISLAYRKGYFRQYLTKDGWQMETYPLNQFPSMPIERVLDGHGDPLKISIDLKGEEVKVQAWRVQIGTTRLFLLDTNLQENSKWSREITSELYGGDVETRIRQEIVLGIGGVRMLRAMGSDPAVFHLNEGHSAFAGFERIRELIKDRAFSFDEALEYVRATNVFTTHTPVPAGIDRFASDLMRAYFESFAKGLGISFDVLLGFGREDPKDRNEEFCMTVLALRLSTWNNGVSRLHAGVSRKMWQKIWPKTPELDLPIDHITNGVHIPSWISKGMAETYDRYLGPRWMEDPDNVKIWERIDKIPDTELWRTHERARERLVTFTRKRLKDQLTRRGHSDREVAIADEVLSSETLTIGFARRFAQYKRADLVLKDMDRLRRILTHEEYPVQIIFAGKAHPRDELGKELIKRLVQTASEDRFLRHLVFLEDYDMEIARHMVQGVDVWLNTPRRPLEACGTSGMKAVANGALHLSVLDGWWDEGYERGNGWTIGGGEEYGDHGFQDELESRALYDILEKEVIPIFYERGPDNLPRQWLASMKASLRRLCPVFNTHRMVEEYWERFYTPAAELMFRLTERDGEELIRLAEWRQRIMYGWQKIAFKNIRMEEVSEIDVGTSFHVETDIFLGELRPEDVIVEAYCGRLSPEDRYADRFILAMESPEHLGDQTYRYHREIRFEEAGRFGINIRVTPNHLNKESRHAMGLVIWGRK